MGYLVLKRRPGEKIAIGADIVIEVVSINGNQVRLGIHAPKDVKILRTELLAHEEKAS